MVVPAGSEAVVIASLAAPTVNMTVVLTVAAVGVDESVTVTTIVLLPALVGMPEMAPVLEFRLNPAGRLPELAAQV